MNDTLLIPYVLHGHPYYSYNYYYSKMCIASTCKKNIQGMKGKEGGDKKEVLK